MFFRVGHGDWRSTGTQRTQSTQGHPVFCKGTLYRNTRGTGFLQEGRARRDSGPSFEEHKEYKGHEERGEAEGQLDL